MNKRWTVIVAAVLLCAPWALARTMHVQVRDGVLRKSPSFLGPVTARVRYGDAVTTVSEQSGWVNVRTAAGEGWIHESALTKKKIVLSGGGQVTTAASDDELALAGKGFNAEVEAEFKQSGNVDYSWIDRMERMDVTQQQMRNFIREGGLQ